MTRASDTAKLLGAGATILDGTTISTADNTDQLILKSTDADASVGPVLRLNRDSGSPADSDLLGSIIFQADDDGGNSINFVEIITQMEDASAASRSADLFLNTRTNGSLISRIGMIDSTTVINDSGADIDFRVESNLQANMFLVDAGEDIVSIVGGGSHTVGQFKNALQIEGTTGSTSSMSITRNTAGTSPPYIQFGKTRGTSAGSNTIVQSGDTLGVITWNGADGTNRDTNAAIIMAEVDGTPGENDMPGRLIFKTTADGASATSERMRITAGGEVGIGESNPTQYYAGGNQLVVRDGTANAGITIRTGTSGAGILAFADGATTAAQQYSGYVQYTHGDNFLAFATAAVERVRIDATGRFFRGSATDLTGASQSFFKNINSGEAGIGIGNNDGAVASNAILFRNSNGNVGSIQTSGSGVTYNTSSDYRLKDNINYTFDGTALVKQLKPCEFNFKADVDTKVTGFLAHEAQAVVSEAVTGTKDATQDVGTVKDADGNVLQENVLESAKGEDETWTKTGTKNVYQGIDQSKLVPLLVKTIQELEARITALEGA